MTRTRRPEHPFPFLERGSPSPHPMAALLATHAPDPSSRFSNIPRQRGWAHQLAAPFLPQPLPSLPFTVSSRKSGTSGWLNNPVRTPALRRYSRMLHQGARVLLDLDTGKCLLYSFSNGIKVLGTLTIRMLSQLLRLGDIVMAARENRWIHFVSPNANLAWFRSED